MTQQESLAILDSCLEKLKSMTLEEIEASAYHYRVIFKPQSIVPDIDLKTSNTDTPTVQE